MTVGLATAGFAIALICVLIMGYAIQRGATCTVAAVSQLMQDGKWGRFAGLTEAALWVAGGLLVARALGLLPELPPGLAVTGWTVVGGVLLGAGAWLNKACVFGTVAKIGSRDWVYLATPAGFVAGAAAVPLLRHPGSQSAADGVSPLLSLPELALIAFAIFATWRIIRVLGSNRGTLAARIWAPHEATVVIGITFVILFVAAGAWAYTDLLAEVAAGMPGDLATRLVLFAALLGGSIVAGSMAGSADAARFSVTSLGRTFGGGAAMGAGSILIPGSNDGLILVGMPLLYPYAWIAIATMCLTIAAAIGVEGWLKGRAALRHATD
jgi:Sulphur transport